MSARPAHTPYDGSAKPFTIGLGPLDLHDWMEIDDRLPDYLAQKEALIGSRRAVVFRAAPGAAAAQAETLALILEHLPRRYPDIYRRDGSLMHIVPAGMAVDLASDEPPLLTAGRLVQEDLVLMIRPEGGEGWVLGAASLCFPSSWSLEEKFGQTMEVIHGAIPGFGPGTRNAVLIDRMFSNLRPELPVQRVNWSLDSEEDLHHPKAKTDRIRLPFLDPGFDNTFIRVERQTLRRLPETGAVLFTIKVYVDPVAALLHHGKGSELAEGLAGQIAALDEAQLAYKGMAGRREALVGLLKRVADASA